MQLSLEPYDSFESTSDLWLPQQIILIDTNIKQHIITVKGRVTDAAGEPLIGVNVLIKESGTGQVTDLNGEFKLPDILFGSPLRISFIGYKPLEVNAR